MPSSYRTRLLAVPLFLLAMGVMSAGQVPGSALRTCAVGTPPSTARDAFFREPVCMDGDDDDEDAFLDDVERVEAEFGDECDEAAELDDSKPDAESDAEDMDEDDEEAGGDEEEVAADPQIPVFGGKNSLGLGKKLGKGRLLNGLNSGGLIRLGVTPYQAQVEESASQVERRF